MKQIEAIAIIRPERLTDTVKGLGNIGSVMYRGRNYKVTLHPKIKLKIVLSDYMVERTIKAIIASVQTGEDGGDSRAMSL
ncbi:P-II family nitrogen regulator [Bacillus sp. S10(2024)]|uniref:P-II family nitrogen regulator n=1 Tax=Bacillus sp. S10(2024) TaxID=3162886 RepID=UPI003D2046F8